MNIEYILQLKIIKITETQKYITLSEIFRYNLVGK